MDSYLYKTTKAEQDAYNKWCEEYENKEKKLIEYGNKLKEIYGDNLFDNEPEVIKSIITPKELETITSLICETQYSNEHNDYNAEGRIELMYWRKAWGLHEYIVENFYNGENDNCERIYLTKENCQMMLEEMKWCYDNYTNRNDDCIFGDPSRPLAYRKIPQK